MAFYHQSSPLHIEEDEDDNDHGLAVQAALDNVGKALPNVGQESKEWRDFLDGFKSSDFYDKILKMYIAWFAAQQWEEVPSLEEGLKLYFVWAHEEKKANGDLRWSASTLQTWLSVFKAFWLHALDASESKAFKNTITVIQTKLTKWAAKQAEVKKAGVFDKEDRQKILNLPTTNSLLPLMFYSVIAIAMAGRSAELLQIKRGQLALVQDGKKVSVSSLARSSIHPYTFTNLTPPPPPVCCMYNNNRIVGTIRYHFIAPSSRGEKR